MTASLLWYDLETWGMDPAGSFIASFACQRTDYSLNPIEPPVQLLCKPPEDCLPDPEAILVHGISPYAADESGLPEYEFARTIHEQFNRPASCVLGFNNIRFDDEFCRYLFYRNLLDPYSHQWRNNNSRWDVIDMFRVCHAFKPDTLSWINKQTGKVSFALQNLARSNEIKVDKAHDALSDVATTIELAKLIKDRQPDMFEYLFTKRTKTQASNFLYETAGKPFVHVSRMFSSHQGSSSLVVPLSYNREQRQKLYVLDLNSDCSALLSLSATELREILFTPRNELPEGISPPMIKTIHLNRCPVVLPARMLGDGVADRLGINLALCNENYKIIDNNRHDIAWKIQEAYDTSALTVSAEDVNRQLYKQLFNDKDRICMDRVHQATSDGWYEMSFADVDERINDLWLRLKARYNLNLLDDYDTKQWYKYLVSLYKGQIDLTPGAIVQLRKIEDIKRQGELDELQQTSLYQLEQYIREKATKLDVALS